MSQQRTGASPVLASARHVKIAGTDYRYGPFTYEMRGELENIYFPNAQSPYQKALEYWESLTDEEKGELTAEQREQNEKDLATLKRRDAQWQFSVEDADAFVYFVSNNERFGQFLSVALPPYNPFRETPDWTQLAAGTTKGDRDEMYSACLEVGPYAPKSFPFQIQANR